MVMVDHAKKNSGKASNPAGYMRSSCMLCGESLSATTTYNLQGDDICLTCLLHLGPERAKVLLSVNKLDPLEVEAAVLFLRNMLTRNQVARLREAIRQGGRNWWVRLPEFGEYVCKAIMDQRVGWDPEVLDEIWDRLVQEAVEE